MNYDNLGESLTKMERVEEDAENDAATGTKTASSDAKSSRPLPDGHKTPSKVATTGIRKVICAGISKLASRYGGYKMDGYTERVDNDTILCDAFHTVAEKRVPSIALYSPECVTVFGMYGHAHATHQSNVKKEAGSQSRTEYRATPEDGINIVEVGPTSDQPAPPPTVYPTEDMFPIDISVHGETVAAEIDPDKFGFQDRDGNEVEAPRSVVTPLTGRKRGRPVNLKKSSDNGSDGPRRPRQPGSPLPQSQLSIVSLEDN
jgi:hypothetical protein